MKSDHVKSNYYYPDWNKNNSEIFWGEIAPCEHVCQIYESDEVFMNLLESFVTHGIKSGDSVIIIATENHRNALNLRLKAQGFDLDKLYVTDQYIPLDAQATLSNFQVDNWPDEALFIHTVTILLNRAKKHGRKVRAFGEMVAILWANGYSGATVRLEHLWQEFCDKEKFSLFCAYPQSGFTQDANTSLDHICQSHTKMVNGWKKSPDDIFYKDSKRSI